MAFPEGTKMISANFDSDGWPYVEFLLEHEDIPETDCWVEANPVFQEVTSRAVMLKDWGIKRG